MKGSRPVRYGKLLISVFTATSWLPAQTPEIDPQGLVNLATGQSASSVPVAARGSLVSIHGNNFSATTTAAERIPIPIQLPGTATQVLVGGIPAPLFYVSPKLINAQIPFELPDSSSLDLVVRNEYGSSAALKVTLLSQDPGVFAVVKSGSLVSNSNPIFPGDTISIYAGGLGAVFPPVPSGHPGPSNPLAVVAIRPVVKVGKQMATVSFAGLAPGLVIYQINATAPTDLAGPTSDVSVEPGVIPAVTGPPGPIGPSGATGAAGPPGPRGATGVAGANGATGPPGLQGPPGLTGLTGPAGPQGVTWRGTWSSATMYAQNDAVQFNGTGYIGIQSSNLNQQPDTSPTFWSVLAQVGATGPAGAAGPIGATGATGPAGADGATGPPGLQGPQGATGATGPAGPQGVTWQGTWVNSTAYALNDAVQYSGTSYISIQAGTGQQPDTSPTFWSVLAQVGATGPTGATGATGPAGANGATGLQGLQGPQGATGATGPAAIYLMAGINSVAPGAANNFASVIGSNIATGTGNEGNFQMPMQFDCTVQNVKVHFQTAPSATVNAAKFYDISLRKNGANTSTTCQIASTATDCVMSVNTVATNLTDLFAWNLVPNQAGAAPANPGVVSITGVCQ